MNDAPGQPLDYDVIIVGGALAGASTATWLLQEDAGLRVLVVERSSAFSRRVGEATVEVSAYFLMRVLGLTQYLNEAHLIKQGFRFWFANEHTRHLDDCGEIGGRYLSRVPSFQLDRATLDEEVLRRAVNAGATLWRPATVQQVVLAEGGPQTVRIKRGENTQTVTARWVVDASGVAAMLARQNGWWRQNEAHPTAAVWSRWRGVKDWDSPDLARKYPRWAKACYGVRGTATNHLMGDGWWAWWIPLKGGDVSIGVVFDQRRMQWPEGGTPGQRLKDFLVQHPIARELLSEAQFTEGDVHVRRNLAYWSTVYAGDGFALVGDAAAFIDPFYSPGLDWLSFTAGSVGELILAERRGEPLAARVAKHNRDFSSSHQRWFNAIYRDKYAYLGDFELLRIGFLLDLGLYYLGVASQPFKHGRRAYTLPTFSTAPSVPFYHFMCFYNARLVRLADGRRARGRFGRRNHARRFLFPGYTFSPGSSWWVIKALAAWAVIELKEGWRTWFRRSAPTPQRTNPVLSRPAVQPVR